MGSFNATCIISGLPIEHCTPVRFVTLTRHSHHKDNEYACYVTGRWQLRCPPVHAEYNDYGSIEKLTPGLTSRVLFESLSRDCIEKGVGDNQCHDVQVRSGMTIDQWLEALWEARVFVADGRIHFPMSKDWTPPEPAEGMPSMRRMETLLHSAGLPVDTAWGASGYFVEEVSRGFIRIRHGSHEEDTAALDQIVPLITSAGYAAMVTCGTGMYNNHAEILVAPRPAPKGAHFHSESLATPDRYETTRPRAVAGAMIREDIWQILLKTPIRGWKKTTTFEDMLADAREVLKGELAWMAEDAAFLARDRATISETERDAHWRKAFRRDMDREDERDNLLRDALRAGEGVSGFSLKESLKFALGLDPSPEDLDAFIIDLAETAWVQWVYAGLHGQWHLSTNNGQDPQWKEHREFLTALLGIKGRWEEELDAEEEGAEDDADEEVDPQEPPV